MQKKDNKQNYLFSKEISTFPQDSFRIKLFHESSGGAVEKVNVFNTCDFSSTESQQDGTINIALNVGECCEFTFSKPNFATKEMTLCATFTEQGIQLAESALLPNKENFTEKGISSLVDEPSVYKDLDKNIYQSNSEHQPFTGIYKGQVYQEGKIKPANFCCAYAIEEEVLVDRNVRLVKKGKRPVPQLLKIGLQSQVNLEVKGLVLEEKHEFPIEEATVILVNQNNNKDRQIQLTNLDGIFDFSLRKNECYQLWVEKENYAQVGEPIQICTHQNEVSQSYEFNIFLK